MNAPVLELQAQDGQSSASPLPWRGVAVSLAAGLLILGGIFNQEIVAAIHTWDTSTAYNHCFLVIPIALYLLWDRRADLTGIAPRPSPAIILLGIPLALIWLLAERLGIMEGRQLVAIAFVEVLLYAVLGSRLWRAMAGPLLYLFFLVPFGEFLTPRLQDVTTWFIRNGLSVLGIPAYIDGYIIEIPQGTFFVAEACAGLRFLIASIAFGVLYALMMYRSPVRRGVFIAVSLIVPIIANGFRGLGIVYLGYLLGSAQAAAADHIIYGWLFFSAVILLLIALGLPFRQDELSTRSARAEPAYRAPARLGSFATAAAVVIVAAITPGLAAGLGLATRTSADATPLIDLGPGCANVAGAPADARAPRVRSQRVTCGAYTMDLAWEAFSPRVTAAPVMAERRRLCLQAETEGLQESWLSSESAAPSAPPSPWRIMRSTDPAYITAVSVWVDGRPVRPGMAMRVRMAFDSILGTAHAPMVMTVTPAVQWSALQGPDRKAVEADLPAFLLDHPDLADRIGALSALR